MIRLILLLLTALLLGGAAHAQTPVPDIILTGTVTGADHQSYIEQSFAVPPGVAAVTVAFSYDRAEATVIDLGLFDGERFRGASGGNKARFTVGADDAMPSYPPGPVRAGTWTLLLGIPNARPGASSAWRAEIFLTRVGAPPAGFADAPLKAEAGWYRGDLHAHSGHSDGSCTSQSGGRSPCPLSRSVATAAARGLDFLAMTEHNTTSHFSEMRALQGAFDRLLLIPGREITTFYGHANLFGPTAFVDFRLGSGARRDVDALLDAVAALGGVLAVNHPALPSGELCMGCGWTADTDWSRIAAIEVVNGGAVAAAGGAVESPLSGIGFWEARLNEGHRLTAIGGSDNHDAELPAADPRAIGRPATVIHAAALSLPALLDGISGGRVFIDVEGVPGRLLDLSARAGKRRAQMGDVLAVRPDEMVEFELRIGGCSGCSAEIIRNAAPLAVLSNPLIAGPDARLAFKVARSGPHDWVRANVRDAGGRLILIGNPIYLRPVP